jgi:hypothetical protein
MSDTNLPQILADIEYVKGRGCPHELDINARARLRGVVQAQESGMTHRAFSPHPMHIACVQATIMEIMGWFCREHRVYIELRTFQDGTYGFMLVCMMVEHTLAEESGYNTPFAAHAAVLRAIVEALKGDDHD